MTKKTERHPREDQRRNEFVPNPAEDAGGKTHTVKNAGRIRRSWVNGNSSPANEHAGDETAEGKKTSTGKK